MDVTQNPGKAEASVAGVADARFTSLVRLAENRTPQDLRHVLPADESGRVAVAAFGSSI